MSRRTFPRRLASVVALTSAAAFAGELPLSAPSHPTENSPNEAKRVLGKILFFEEQLSSDNSVACATCHVMARGGTDPRRLRGVSKTQFSGGQVFASPGVVPMASDGRYLGASPDRQVTPRTAPSPFGAGYTASLLWDGAAGDTFVDPFCLPVDEATDLAEHSFLQVAQRVGHIFRHYCVGKVADLAQSVANGLSAITNGVTTFFHIKNLHHLAF